MKKSKLDTFNHQCGNGSYIDVNKYFNKKYTFHYDDKWQLPKRAFMVNKWSVPSLQDKKVKLNGVKGQLNGFPLLEWSNYTKQRDPSGFIIKYLKQQFNPELLTQV